MENGHSQHRPPRRLRHAELDQLLQLLRQEGRQLIGPRARNGVVEYAEIEGIHDLPQGVTEDQSAGRYTLKEGTSGMLFGYATTANSLKPFFHPPRQQLFSLKKGANGPVLTAATHETAPVALIGARSCDVAALSVLDGVLRDGSTPDHGYAARRSDVVVIAVRCSVAGGTCFCTSMNATPSSLGQFDVALTELPNSSTLVAEAGSPKGEALLDAVSQEQATDQEVTQAQAAVQAAEQSIEKQVNTEGLPQLLQERLDSPRWDLIAERCLACGNCTMACPTCFCSNTEEQNGWDGEVGRVLTWDSCFTTDHSYVHGGAVRPTIASKYRQWLTHKFSTWFDQFGNSGCVGCGRCITWCPVGIDVTEELTTLREEEQLNAQE